MKLKSTAILLSLVLLAGTSMAAQWWIPAAAHANGAQGSVWRTDLVIHNFSGEPAALTLSLLPQNRDNSALNRTRTYTLEAGNSLMLDDLLASEFSFNGTAALKIDSENERLAISSRTYNLGEDGTYGQTIPAVRSEEIVSNEAYRILGISGSDGRRSNAGWVNLDAAENTVSVYLFDGNGELLNSRTYTTAPYSQKQINDVFEDLGVAPVDSGWLRIHSSGRIAPYASVVAAGSNDPIYVPPSRLLDASSELLIPAAAHVNGLGSTQWKTDVWVMNIGSEPTTPTFELWPQNGGEAMTVSLPDPIVPGELLSVTDISSSIFGSTNLQGALILSADTELLATSRTYNTAPEGSFGQFIPSQPLNALPGAGDQLLLEGAVADDAFRSNIGFVSTNDELRLSMRLIDPSGTEIAARNRNLQAHQQIQKSVLSWFGLDSVPAGSSIEISIDNAQGGLAAYLSVVDSNSTDPSYRTAAPAYGEEADPQMANQSIMATTYALSTAVDHSGPKMMGKTTAECVETNYEGDTLRPGDVALCTTRAYIRPVHVEYAVGKGVNVFMEKPVAANYADGYEIVTALESRGFTHGVVHHMLRTPGVLAARELLPKIKPYSVHVWKT